MRIVDTHCHAGRNWFEPITTLIHEILELVGFAVTYPTDVFEYLWYWRSFGAWGYPWYGKTYNVGLEPCTSFDNGGMDSATENGSVRRFAAGETVSASIKAIAFTGTGEVTRVSPEGAIERA